MANENVFIKYLNNHGVDAVQLLSAKELAKKTVLTDEEEVEAIVNAMMSRMSNYVTQSQMINYINQNVQAFPEATEISSSGVLIAYPSTSTEYVWTQIENLLSTYSIVTSSTLSSYATLSALSAFAPASALSNYATLADISAFAPASILSSYVTTLALTQDYMPVWYGSQAAFDALPSSANPNKLYIIID